MLKRIKKLNLILLTTFLCVSGSIVRASSSIGLVSVLELSFREQASSSSAELFVLEYGQPVTITGSASTNWYSATIYNNNQQVNGYVYKSSIQIYSADSSFESKISSFPDSYKQALRYIHCLSPNWTFTTLSTNLDFSTAASGFQAKALVDGSDTALRENNTVLEGSNWYRANLATTSYFLDPRNFLIGSRILMFEKLSFDSSQTLAQVEQVLSGSYMATLQSGDTKTFAEMFYNAGQTYNVSPIYLAIRALQEQGSTGTGGIGSQGGTVSGDSNVYYNIFNIGATSGAQAGIAYAQSKGWTTREASINGGAQYIASDYINASQDSLYLQRFNVHPNNRSKVYSHSYMTNIRAPYSEAFKTCKSYLNTNTMSVARTIVIPVYTSQTTTTYPGTMNRLTIDASSSLPASSSSTSSSSSSSSSTTTTSYPRGDVDGSGTVSAVDYVVIKNHIMGKATLSGDKLSRADVNGDGSVSAVDYVLIKNHIMGVSKLS